MPSLTRHSRMVLSPGGQYLHVWRECHAIYIADLLFRFYKWRDITKNLPPGVVADETSVCRKEHPYGHEKIEG